MNKLFNIIYNSCVYEYYAKDSKDFIKSFSNYINDFKGKNHIILFDNIQHKIEFIYASKKYLNIVGSKYVSDSSIYLNILKLRKLIKKDLQSIETEIDYDFYEKMKISKSYYNNFRDIIDSNENLNPNNKFLLKIVLDFAECSNMSIEDTVKIIEKAVIEINKK